MTLEEGKSKSLHVAIISMALGLVKRNRTIKIRRARKAKSKSPTRTRFARKRAFVRSPEKRLGPFGTPSPLLLFGNLSSLGSLRWDREVFTLFCFAPTAGLPNIFASVCSNKCTREKIYAEKI